MPGGGGPHRGLHSAAVQLHEGVALPLASAHAGRPGGASDTLLGGIWGNAWGQGVVGTARPPSVITCLFLECGLLLREHWVWFHGASSGTSRLPPQHRAAL